MANDMSGSVTLLADSTEVALDLAAMGPAPALLRAAGTVSIGANGRDQYLALLLNGDGGAGQYQGMSIDFAPGYHGDVVRSINNGLIVGYTGWGLDADVVFDLVISVAAGIARNVCGSYTTTHSDGRKYISRIGGTYLNRTMPITRWQLTLPSGGVFRGGQLAVSAAG